MEEEQKKLVESSFLRIDDFLNKLSEEGSVYFFCFIILIFNYKRFFLIKQERNNNSKKHKLKESNKIKIFIDDND